MPHACRGVLVPSVSHLQLGSTALANPMLPTRVSAASGSSLSILLSISIALFFKYAYLNTFAALLQNFELTVSLHTTQLLISILLLRPFGALLLSFLENRSVQPFE